MPNLVLDLIITLFNLSKTRETLFFDTSNVRLTNYCRFVQPQQYIRRATYY